MEVFSVPEVDMVMVSKNSQNERNEMLKFVPQIGLNNINYGDMYRLDSFYLDCQNYRDHYRDPYNKLLRPKRFSTQSVRCGIKLDPQLELLKKRTPSHVDPIPVVYPVEYSRRMDFDRGFQMSGRHARASAFGFPAPCVRVLGR
ncbi:uncharacterized protein [Drosophila kikkawai]|uniref:Uncharacterized protein n=1 Tax=Drosophila kikkawai TaxID=30033 RepID=A0A6P4JAN6_DROKI|nr:uncharacterized protein LOC108085728 [Drosophila kikkawai]